MPRLVPETRRTALQGRPVRRDVLDRPDPGMRGEFAGFMGHDGQLRRFLPRADAIVARFGPRAQLSHPTICELFP